jgi:DNA polymerase III subunit gamma/tau
VASKSAPVPAGTAPVTPPSLPRESVLEPVPAPRPIAPAAPVPVHTTISAATPVSEATRESLWAGLMVSASPILRASLERGHPVSFDKNILTVGFGAGSEDQISIVESRQSTLQTGLRSLGFPGVQFKFVRAEPPPGWQSPARPGPDEEAPKASPKAEPEVPVASGATAWSAPVLPVPSKQKPAPVPFNKDDFKNDPLIQKALEIFKGQIVEVRAS